MSSEFCLTYTLTSAANEVSQNEVSIEKQKIKKTVIDSNNPHFFKRGILNTPYFLI